MHDSTRRMLARTRWLGPIMLTGALMVLAAVSTARAQGQTPDASVSDEAAEPESAEPPTSETTAPTEAASAPAFDWRANFIDPEDGKLDVSGFLSRGGFIPVPIIITEPAVDGGFGIVAQFIHTPTSPGTSPGRTIVGGAITGNESMGGGLLQQGTLADDRLVYRFGLGLADVTLPIFPFGGSTEIDYGNEMKFGFGNIRYRIADTPLSIGPRFIYRTSDVSLKAEGPLADRVNNVLEGFSGEQQYVALGLSLNYDTRNNPFTPTDGMNAILKYDFYSDALGSDKEFGAGQLAIHSFSDIGAMLRPSAVAASSNCQRSNKIWFGSGALGSAGVR